MALEPVWVLKYRGTDITSEIAPMVTSVRYTDKLHGEADEIDVTVQDADGLWRGPWCPEPGDTMELWYGRGVPTSYAGLFELDEPETAIGRGGDTMTMRGIAVPITKALRTERSAEYEERDLEAIVGEVAGRAGLSVSGSFNATRWRTKRQRQMRDLEFIVALGEDTDHYVSVRGREVQFNKVDDIDGAPPAARVSIHDRDFVSFTGRFETQGTHSGAKVSHLHDERKELVEGEESDGRVKTGDTLRVVGRVEDEAQAKLMARSRLHRANRRRRNGQLVMVARDDLVAGSVIELLPDFGRWAGRYVVDSSAHELTRGPYPTTLELSEARS